MGFYQNVNKLLFGEILDQKYKSANTMKLVKWEACNDLPSVPGIKNYDKIIFLQAVIALQLKVLKFKEETIFSLNC